jgi:hypothetical protein
VRLAPLLHGCSWSSASRRTPLSAGLFMPDPLLVRGMLSVPFPWRGFIKAKHGSLCYLPRPKVGAFSDSRLVRRFGWRRNGASCSKRLRTGSQQRGSGACNALSSGSSWGGNQPEAGREAADLSSSGNGPSRETQSEAASDGRGGQEQTSNSETSGPIKSSDTPAAFVASASDSPQKTSNSSSAFNSEPSEDPILPPKQAPAQLDQQASDLQQEPSNFTPDSAALFGDFEGMPAEKSFQLYQGTSYEWKQQQAMQVVAALFQQEGVKRSQAERIAALAPLYCSSLLDKVSELDGPPDIWDDLGLLEQRPGVGELPPGREGDFLAESADDEEQNRYIEDQGRKAKALAAAFPDAYMAPGESPMPAEKRDRNRKPPKPSKAPETDPPPRSRRRREIKLRGVRRRAEQQSELEELLGIGPTRGEPYRLAEWERERAAAEKGGQDVVDAEGGGQEKQDSGVESLGGGAEVAAWKEEQREGKESSDVEFRTGGEREGISDSADVGRPKGVNMGSSEGAVDFNDPGGAGSSKDCSGLPPDLQQTESEGLNETPESGSSEPVSEDDSASESRAETGESIPSFESPPEKTTAEGAYRWKLQWCADENHGGGLLPPFFESLGIPPNEAKRLVRVLRRPRSQKNRVALSIVDVIKRVEVFERLLQNADGLGAAKRLLDRSKDEALGRMKEDDDIERNVRYLEAAESASRELRAASSYSPSTIGDVDMRQQSTQSVVEPSQQSNQSDLYRPLASQEQKVSEVLNRPQTEETFMDIEPNSTMLVSKQLEPAVSGDPQASSSADQYFGRQERLADQLISFADAKQVSANPAANPSPLTNPVVLEPEEAPLPTLTGIPPQLFRQLPNQQSTTMNADSPNPDSGLSTPNPGAPTPNHVSLTPSPETLEPLWSVGLIVSSFPELLFPGIETRNFEAMVAYMEQELEMTSAEAANVLLLFPPAFALDVETELKPRMRDLKVGGECSSFLNFRLLHILTCLLIRCWRLIQLMIRSFCLWSLVSPKSCCFGSGVGQISGR